MGKSLAFHSYKGGTGKTSLVINLGALYESRVPTSASSITIFARPV